MKIERNDADDVAKKLINIMDGVRPQHPYYLSNGCGVYVLYVNEIEVAKRDDEDWMYQYFHRWVIEYPLQDCDYR